MAGQDTAATVERGDRILDVNVIDPVRKRANKGNWIDELPQQMAWIEVEAEFWSTFHGFERALGSINIERNFGRMNFEREFYTAFGKDIEDRVPALCEKLEAIVDHLAWHWWKIVDQVPDARAGKTVYNANAGFLWRVRCSSFLLRRVCSRRLDCHRPET